MTLAAMCVAVRDVHHRAERREDRHRGETAVRHVSAAPGPGSRATLCLCVQAGRGGPPRASAARVPAAHFVAIASGPSVNGWLPCAEKAPGV